MRATYLVATILALTLCTLPCVAWGPTADQAVVNTAMHVLTKEGTAPLSKLEKDVREGATASEAVMSQIYPAMDTSVVQAIETEMNLLSTVRQNVLSPYLAYRLGLLGRLVARVSAPLADTDSPYRQQYYADVDRNILRIPLELSKRKFVDPPAYFERVRQLANSRKDLLLKDYQDGLGFAGIAKAGLPDDYSRSVDAVADVWDTIFRSGAVRASVSDAQVSDYILQAMRYYIQRKNQLEIDANYRKLSELMPKTPDMAKIIGDMFYESGFYEKAIDEYRFVLRAEPERRDVVERIAAYHMRVGEEYLAKQRLEQALDAFSSALKVDALHPTAEARRLDVERMIAERDARQETARRSVETAAAKESEAEAFALKNDFAGAVAALKESRDIYESVTDEFATEYHAATLGMANVETRLRDLKSQLIQNAQNLSGSAVTMELRQAAAVDTRKLDEDALRALNSKRFQSEINRLRGTYQSSFEIR